MPANTTFLRCILVFLGGGTGAVMRLLLSRAIVERYGARFPPLGTLIINVTGCFLIGLLMSVLTGRHPSHANLRFLLVVGVLGGYTTFSSFEYETYVAVQGGVPWVAIANVVGSVAFGYLAVWLGSALASRAL